MRIEASETRGSRDELEQISAVPKIWVADGFFSAEETAAAMALAPQEGSETADALDAKHDETGFSLELPVATDPLLGALKGRLDTLLGVANALDDTFRFRRYGPGEAHPEHVDCYAIAGKKLIFTALLHLEDGAVGGDTVFPHTEQGEIAIAPRAGRLVVWCNYTEDGQEDPASSHAGAALESGFKTTLTWFVYGPTEAVAHNPATGPFVPSPRGPGQRLYFVDDDVPGETTELFREACEKKGIDFYWVDADIFDFSAPSPLEPGDMIYRAAVSGAAHKAEQHLFVDGAATLYSDPDGVFFDTGAALALFERAGVPAPRTVYCHTTNREMLLRYAEYVGGFPLLAKFPGASGGVNVVLIESPQGLFSFVDHALFNGSRPILTAYVPDAEHWRIIVVGDKPVGAYLNAVRPGDFRTYDDEDPENYRFPEDTDMLVSAIQAVACLHVEFGGVDVLYHPSGRHYVLEANFPCYFAPAQTVGGFDIAGAIVEHLQAKAIALT